jgi:hypothetical protein
MLAGGIGNISAQHAKKNPIPAGAALIQLGGPAMLIGLGGSAASSMDTGSNVENLDFDSDSNLFPYNVLSWLRCAHYSVPLAPVHSALL